MTNYVIIALPDSTISDQVVEVNFPDHISIVPGIVWAVGTTLGTCADVRDRLGVNPNLGTDRPTCVIVKVTEYNGYASRDLWEKLALWERT